MKKWLELVEFMRRILSLGSGNRGFKERREALFSTLESHDGLTDGYRSEKEKKRSYFIIFSLSHREEEERKDEERRKPEYKGEKPQIKKGLLHN